MNLLIPLLPLLALAAAHPLPRSPRFTLPPLPYAHSALEPHLSADLLALHHAKHHAAYTNNLNTAVASLEQAIAGGDVLGIIAAQESVRFNGGGYVNHGLFWEGLKPRGEDKPEKKEKQDAADGKLARKIAATYGSVGKLKTAFGAAAAALQGSGWVWLVKNPGGALEIVTKQNQDPVLPPQVPLLGVDVWEHSYYLQYKNNRTEYLENIWQVLNWEVAEKRYSGEGKLPGTGKEPVEEEDEEEKDDEEKDEEKDEEEKDEEEKDEEENDEEEKDEEEKDEEEKKKEETLERLRSSLDLDDISDEFMEEIMIRKKPE